MLKQLRVNISTEKLKEINEDDEQKIDLLDILETVARNMIVDVRTVVSGQTLTFKYNTFIKLHSLIILYKCHHLLFKKL